MDTTSYTQLMLVATWQGDFLVMSARTVMIVQAEGIIAHNANGISVIHARMNISQNQTQSSVVRVVMVSFIPELITLWESTPVTCATEAIRALVQDGCVFHVNMTSVHSADLHL